MIEFQTYCQIHDLLKKGLTVAQIAAELQLDARTVDTWAREPKYRPRQGARRPGKLDNFKGLIVALLERHPYTARQIFQQIQQQGYAGGYTVLKEFVRQVRPVQRPAFLNLSFAPGECAQIDWGTYKSVQVGSTRRRLSFFVMVLCYSRLMYVEFTLSQGMEQFLSCHQRALQFFGGVPGKVMVDNMKVAVLSHPEGRAPQFNPRYLDFAAHHGFEPVACAPRKGNEKGRVENGVGYVKKNLLAGLNIPSFEAINPEARNWLDATANVRIHGATRRKPIELFQEEKPFLKPLPVMPYDCGVVRPASANRCCRVIFETNRYSVPHLYASQKLSLKVYPDQLILYHHEKLIAQHSRSYDRHRDIENPDHTRELLLQRKKARHQTLLLAFLNLTPQAELYCRKLQEKRLNAPHHIEKIVALGEIYGPEKVGRAIQDAIRFEAYGCEYVANILEQHQNVAGNPGVLHLTHRQDLLDLDLPAADLSSYEPKHQPDTKPSQHNNPPNSQDNHEL
jgi:transposase